MMNVVIYARYSYSGQREESIEGQMKACREYANEHDYNVIHEYIDRGKSATTANRPQFQQMLLDSKKHCFEAVIVYQLDRFARNRYDSAVAKHSLRKNGVTVLSATEGISDSPEGQMLEGILESMAEYQSQDMAVKIKRGHMVNAEKCVYNGGPVPLGYYIDDEHHYQIDEKMAPIVQKVFHDYADNIPIVDIVEELNVAGIRTSRGTAFTVDSFRTLLKNKRYTGCYVYAGVEVSGGIPRIIEDELFDKVQEKVKRNKHKKSSRIRYLLSTKVFCGECDSVMVGHSGTSKTGREYSYYSCNKHREHKCGLKNVPKEKLEDIVVAECRKRLTDDSIKAIAKEVALLTEEENNSPMIRAMEKKRDDCRRAIDNLMIALEQGRQTDLILDRLDKKHSELQAIEDELAIETSMQLKITEPEIAFFLTDLRQGKIDNFKYRQRLISILVNRVYVYKDHITIYFNSSKDPVEIKDEVLEGIEQVANEEHFSGQSSQRSVSGVPNNTANKEM